MQLSSLRNQQNDAFNKEFTRRFKQKQKKQRSFCDVNKTLCGLDN